MQYHVAFLQSEPLDRIASGVKTCEVRLHKSFKPKAWAVEPFDVLLFKRTGGEIEFAATVTKVDRFSNLTPQIVKELSENLLPYNGVINPAFWDNRLGSKFGVVIYFTRVRPIEIPIELTPRSVMDGWVTNFLGDSRSKSQGVLQPQVYQPTLF